jgi:hypothetical protein
MVAIHYHQPIQRGILGRTSFRSLSLYFQPHVGPESIVMGDLLGLVLMSFRNTP